MTSMQKQIDSVVANFPKPKGNIKMNEPSAEPNPLAIIKFTKHLQSCAISIPNSNDDLGYLGAIVSDDIYQKCNANGTSYTAPNDPGRAPVYSAPEPTEATGPATRSGTARKIVRFWMYSIFQRHQSVHLFQRKDNHARSTIQCYQ